MLVGAGDGGRTEVVVPELGEVPGTGGGPHLDHRPPGLLQFGAMDGVVEVDESFGNRHGGGGHGSTVVPGGPSANGSISGPVDSLAVAASCAVAPCVSVSARMGTLRVPAG
ncbi:hypothetical protein GCM10023217_24920 [Gordonia alkaliphila]|uniref:Uncharacterized protein n=1 Tax=Gordonia alkaliphila TaxID=1053547 RepID=A0ABP8ZCQ0_9ACTN